MQVSVNMGSVTLYGHSDGHTSTYSGIPYGLSPTGERRFRPPQAYIWHQKEYWADSPLHAAFQPERLRSNASMVDTQEMSEDCLFLNVFSPTEPAPDAAGYPVMVWLHGGSAIYGSAGQPIYEGSKLAANGIVVVTVNYRLGVFGYLELGNILGPDYAGSGNNATRDQLLALEWVHKHIGSFYGDSKKITLAGESSGAKAVCNLLALPAARSMLRSVAISSGTASCVNTPDDAWRVSHAIINYLDINAHPEDILTADSHQLLEAQIAVTAAWPRLYPFRAVVDGDMLTDTPLRVLQHADCTSLRVLAGFNHDDGWFQLTSHYLSSEENRDEACSVSRLSHFDLTDFLQLSKEMTQNMPQYTLLQKVSDAEYIIPCIKLIDVLQAQGAQTYLYQFDVRQTRGPFSGYSVHASDLPYIWQNFDDAYMSDFTRNDAQSLTAGTSLHRTWVNFIKTGEPSGYRGTLPRYYAHNRLCLSYSVNGISDIHDEIQERVALWHELAINAF